MGTDTGDKMATLVARVLFVGAMTALLGCVVSGQRNANMQAWNDAASNSKPAQNRKPTPFPVEAWLRSMQSRCTAAPCDDFNQDLFRVLDRDLSGELGTSDIAALSLGLGFELNQIELQQCLELMASHDPEPAAAGLSAAGLASFLSGQGLASKRWLGRVYKSA